MACASGWLAYRGWSVLLLAISSDNRIYFDGQELRADQVAGVLKQAAVGHVSTFWLIRTSAARSSAGTRSLRNRGT